MVTITNGQLILTVPQSAFKQMYQASGFHLYDGENGAKDSGVAYPMEAEKTPSRAVLDEENPETREPEEEDTEDVVEDEIDLSEIPLSEMDFYQLCDYADQLGIDRRGVRSKKELRNLIKNNI